MLFDASEWLIRPDILFLSLCYSLQKQYICVDPQ